MRRRFGTAARCVATAAVLALGLAGCAEAVDPLPPVGTAVDQARPLGVQDPAEIPGAAASAAPDCEARASFRPPASMPKPGAMPAGSTMSRIAKRGRLIVGVDQNSYRFGFRDPLTGELTGFDVDVAREVARAVFGDPSKIQFRAINSAARIPSLQDRSVDLVVQTMTMNCERWQQVSFSTEYFDAGQRILVRRGSSVRSIADLGGQKVCATIGSTSIRAVAAAPAKPLPVAVPDWTDCLVMLQQGQVEAISTDDTILAGLAAQDPNVHLVGSRFTDEPYGIAVSQKSPELVRFVNSVLDRMRSDGTWAAIYTKWLGGPAPAPPAAKYKS